MGRCAKCLQWKPVNTNGEKNYVVILECPACVYRTARCEDCGGTEGAWRSLRCHWAFYKARRAGAGNHAERLKLWFDRFIKNYAKNHGE